MLQPLLALHTCGQEYMAALLTYFDARGGGTARNPSVVSWTPPDLGSTVLVVAWQGGGSDLS